MAQQPAPVPDPVREEWESRCLAALVARRRNVDRDDAKALVRAAWSIERYRRMEPGVAAAELLANRAVQPGSG